jgi:sigma-E factor negative regulatory protein RseA
VSVEADISMEMGASQLSAMFDGQLSEAECELLSRRLSRDEQLRGRWARYALIGAAMRSEAVAAVSGGFSQRVSAAISVAGAAGDTARAARTGAALSGARRLALGGALVACVAGVSIFVLRSQMLLGEPALSAYIPSVQKLAIPTPGPTPMAPFARNSAPATFASREPVSYIVPPSGAVSGTVLPASLANYVVAHSEYSSPLARSGLISSLVAGDATLSVPAPASAAEAEVIIAADGSR